MKPQDLPPYTYFMLPILKAVQTLGGSGTGREITQAVLDAERPSDEVLGVLYASEHAKPVYLDRMEWARSYAKLGGALDSPRRGLYLLTPFGRELLAIPEQEALSRLKDMDATVRRARYKKRVVSDEQASQTGEVGPPEDIDDDATGDDLTWQDVLLGRLHKLTPDGFEEFVLALLRAYGLQLERRGGTGDEGIDGIGTAPLSDVLSARVAVQAKRYDPDGKPVSRDTVALFQRDAAAAGAERAVIVTLGRFTEAARKAAIQSTPSVDLIDGQRLCELTQRAEMGVKLKPTVEPSWFDRFDDIARKS